MQLKHNIKKHRSFPSSIIEHVLIDWLKAKAKKIIKFIKIQNVLSNLHNLTCDLKT